MDEIPPSWNFTKGIFLKVTATDHVHKKGQEIFWLFYSPLRQHFSLYRDDQKNTKRFKFVVISGIPAIEGCYKFCTNKAFFPLIIETMHFFFFSYMCL